MSSTDHHANLPGRHRTQHTVLFCATFAILLLGGCSDDPKPPPQKEMQVELTSGSIEPRETRGAPYPPAPPSERNPNPDDGEWLPVPDGPPVGDLQPANEQIGIKEVEVDKDDDDKKTQR
ncbi:MAG: hypothetical protein O7C67_17415 [Gammaproteobacteria bacterium]|nr:hypothetical protein [Gammaproteobacteria bacterium]